MAVRDLPLHLAPSCGDHSNLTMRCHTHTRAKRNENHLLVLTRAVVAAFGFGRAIGRDGPCCSGVGPEAIEALSRGGANS
jgi:hypothetical protein